MYCLAVIDETNARGPSDNTSKVVRFNHWLHVRPYVFTYLNMARQLRSVKRDAMVGHRRQVVDVEHYAHILYSLVEVGAPTQPIDYS